jgi:hypothetical protein
MIAAKHACAHVDLLAAVSVARRLMSFHSCLHVCSLKWDKTIIYVSIYMFSQIELHFDNYIMIYSQRL